MKLEFTKMHGCGNDYIYVDCFKTELADPSFAARTLSRRHFSIGSDGLVMICPSDKADAKMRMFNADGSEGRMCGNAIRCVGKYLYDSGIAKKSVIAVDTLSGIKTLHMIIENGKAVGASVDMGRVSFKKEDVPVVWEAPGTVNVPIVVEGRRFLCTAVSVGSPHCVCFVDDVQAFPLEKYGPAFENHPVFPERVNAEFVSLTGKNALSMRVWERGSGETWACGTGSCASAAAACALGLCDYGADIAVQLKGGRLVINVGEDLSVTMTGPAAKVCSGVVYF